MLARVEPLNTHGRVAEPSLWRELNRSGQGRGSRTEVAEEAGWHGWWSPVFHCQPTNWRTQQEQLTRCGTLVLSANRVVRASWRSRTCSAAHVGICTPLPRLCRRKVGLSKVGRLCQCWTCLHPLVKPACRFSRSAFNMSCNGVPALLNNHNPSSPS